MNKPYALSLLVALGIVLGLGVAPGVAQEPAPEGIPLSPAFTYQGQLHRDGDPVNATCNLRFALYDALVGGSRIGPVLTRTGVSVAGGLFTIADLDFGGAAFAGEKRWLAVQVQCAGDPSYTTLSPRQELTPSPYAIHATNADRLDGQHAGAFAVAGHGHWGQSWSGSGTGLTLSGGSTGLLGSGSAYGVRGETATTYGWGVSGVASATSGTAYGVRGDSASSSGRGVSGSATATSGTTYGVYGQSHSTAGRGVYGWASAAEGYTAGVEGESDSTSGLGVRGHATAASGSTCGVAGRSDSPEGAGVYGLAPGTGVYGFASETSGQTYGVYGLSASPAGRGVYGYAAATSGGSADGVVGRTDAGDGAAGVFGYAWNSSDMVFGVLGVTYSPYGAGVRGVATQINGDFGLFSHGNIGATGSKSAIVQTQDYDWRHLYAVESPDVLFEDVGTAELVDGQAVVPIEPVFAQTVNLAEPYQVFLTPLGDCGLYVAEKAADSFTVRALGGQACSLTFDWRLVAKRLGYEDVRLAPAVDPAQFSLQDRGEEAQPPDGEEQP